jgi:hypothetical protein
MVWSIFFFWFGFLLFCFSVITFLSYKGFFISKARLNKIIKTQNKTKQNNQQSNKTNRTKTETKQNKTKQKRV